MTEKTLRTDTIAEAADYLRQRLGERSPNIAIVLGSGLGQLARAIEHAITISYEEIPGFPSVGVAGHAGELICGKLEGATVMLQSGRFHLYEGHDPRTVVLPVRVFAEIGTKTLVVTNAAGGVRRTLTPPALMLIADHINLTSRYPLMGPVVEGEERFPDMSRPYDEELRAIAHEAATNQGISLDEGVYVGLLGPSYETPAEIRMLERLGADAVGMSTVLEVITARARGMRVLGISTIANQAAGISPTPLSHTEVLEAGKAVAENLEAIVREVVRRIS